MGTCQNCGKKSVETRTIEMAGSSKQVCAECYSKIEENRAKYARRKAEAEDHERKSKAEYNERKARGE